VKGRVVPTHARTAYRGSRNIAPLISNLVAEGVVKFKDDLLKTGEEFKHVTG